MFNSRCQLPDCLNYGLAKLIQSPSFQASIEDFTYTGASNPELEVISFVGHGILKERKLEAQCRSGSLTCPDYGQKRTGATKSNLSRWDTTTGILCNI